ncbi:hypothetical protein CFC21_066777 [Triticum aestivum]|uniref:Sister chromatid cohesion 1 protein 3 n=3 Tax=Triticum TaxID=4564 RepID=A0A9R0TU42_TRITD|nr:hypothetical protein CFC21_066777 [Triticum aestivum]VAI19888.1 unnamed protein product [Triticum turgidum subsp. durum]
MFYSHSVLARKSPLGTVWIAAHLERKVNRTQIDGVDVPSYAASIMDPEVPIALRLSGHLLLGLVRIYSWKVNHLFQDCNRMLSAVRTAFASMEAIDLPVDADRAPFEVITLPETFSLDDLSLDDAIRQMDTPDRHRRAYDQITLSGEGYVMITLDEDGGAEFTSPAGRSSGFEPVQHEQETFPPFLEDIIPVDPPLQGSLSVNPINGHQDTPEILRRATDSVSRFEDVIDGGDPMDEDPSPFIEKVTTPPAMHSPVSPVLQTSIPNVPTRISHEPVEEAEEPGGGAGLLAPAEFVLEPSPPPQVQGNRRRRRANAQENRRRPIIDEEIVLPNDYMSNQVDGIELGRLVRRRKILPHTAVDVWRFNRISQKDSLFFEPLVQGMCSDLHKAYEGNYPRVSDSDAQPADVVNVRDSDAQPADAVNVRDKDAPTRNADTQEPEPHLTLNSLGNGEATPFDSPPELPRFSPQKDLSPVREEDHTPFETPGRSGTPRSGLGGTGVTVPLTHCSYASLGKNTVESDFPFGTDDLDEDLPGFPGLMNTPSMISSAGTSTTGLGSIMSTRTRAAAQYFKGMMSSATLEDQPGKFSLNRILDGRTKKQAASMFFETLALKSYDYIDVHQEEAYGDISVSVRPSLSSAKL